MKILFKLIHANIESVNIKMVYYLLYLYRWALISIWFISPEVLADKPSPPCLVFQGQRDSLVKAATTMKLKDQYEARDNNECAIIFMPFGGHSCDVYFPGYYNQTFLYYLERFMFFDR